MITNPHPYRYSTTTSSATLIDGGGGKDVIHFGEPLSATSEGSLDPKNIEVLRLDQGSQRWSIEGEHPDMIVEIYGGGVEISEDAKLKQIKVMWNADMKERGLNDAFVTVKQDDVINFRKAFTNFNEKLVFDPTWDSPLGSRDYTLLSGQNINANLQELALVSIDEFDRFLAARNGTNLFYSNADKSIRYSVFVPDIPYGIGSDIVIKAQGVTST